MASDNGLVQSDSKKAARMDKKRHISFLRRLEHFTWAWFCFPMSTGGLALLMSSQPHSFPGLRTIGKTIFVFDVAIFLLIAAAITYRFIRFPYTLVRSITAPTEGLFVPTALLSIASILACIARYGIASSGPWLVTTHFVLFWIYFAATFTTSVAHYYLLFTSPKLRIQDMTPAWDLPIFPFMLCGTVATAGVPFQPPDHAMTMLVAGLTAQGLGFLVSILMFASYVRRMIQYGFPSPASRPGMFISVGPPSFTSLTMIGLARSYPDNTYFGDVAITRQVVVIMATFSAIFIWSLSLWFFMISLVSVFAVARKLTFHLNWWAFVFPNVGFTIATINIGEVLQSQGIQWVGSIMSICLVATYLFVGVMHVRAVCRKKVMWSGLDEDVHVDEAQGKKDGEESNTGNEDDVEKTPHERSRDHKDEKKKKRRKD